MSYKIGEQISKEDLAELKRKNTLSYLLGVSKISDEDSLKPLNTREYQIAGAHVLGPELALMFAEEVNVIPCNDPLSGVVGYAIWYLDKSGEERSVSLKVPVFVKATEQEHQSKETMKAVYEEAIEKDALIERYDDLPTLRIGFIVTTRSKRIWHWIKASLLTKERECSKK